MRASMTTLSLITALLALACTDAGTSTGNPSGETPPSGNDPDGPDEDDDKDPDDGHEDDGNPALGGFGCEAGDSTVLSSLDADTPLGFTAADILAFAEGEHEVTIRWNPIEIASYGPETGDHTLTITVSHDDGEIRFVEPKESDDGTDIGLLIGSGECTGWLEIDVTIALETDGGALDESFETTLRAQSPLQAVAFHRPEDDLLDGAFEITEVKLEGFTLAQLDFSMTFTTLGPSGNLSAVFEMHSDDAVTAVGGGGGLATWGATDCNDDFYGSGVSSALDQEILGATPDDILELFAQKPSVDLRWADGETTQSTMSFTASGETACVIFDADGIGNATVSIPGTLTMLSDDGRVDATWNGRLGSNISPDTGVQQADFELSGNLQEPSDSEDPGTFFGFPLTDAEGYDFWSLGVRIAVAATGDTTSTMGELRFTGFELAECAGGDPDEPDMSSGSAGSNGEPEGEPGSMGGSAGSAEPGSAGSTGGGTDGCRGSDPFELEAATVQ